MSKDNYLFSDHDDEGPSQDEEPGFLDMIMDHMFPDGQDPD